MKDSGFVLTKALVGLIVALIPVGLVYIIAYATGARGTAIAWIFAAVVILVGAALFSIYGLIFGLVFRSESAVGAASGSLVILAFMGNLFFPLSGTLLSIAKFTPLYGIASLAKRTLTDGYLVGGIDGQDMVFEPLWQPVTNIVVWALILGAFAVLAVRHGRRRQ